jgi:nucleotide-binding universal stress UspA family protein
VTFGSVPCWLVSSTVACESCSRLLRRYRTYERKIPCSSCCSPQLPPHSQATVSCGSSRRSSMSSGAGRIVVGVDGSDHSLTALRWALHAASLREARLDVVHVWICPYKGHPRYVPYELTEEVLEQKAWHLLAQSIDQAGPPPSGVNLQPILAEGNAATVLLAQARTADLLVVGSRGRGGVAGLLLGSVSRKCAERATCPVAIVPSTWRLPDPGASTNHPEGSSREDDRIDIPCQ